jgi:alginate O-acetyltransferase complex protein AlgI
MLFNSFQFILFFLPVTFVVYFVLQRMRLATMAKGWLILSSLFFYSWWNVNYLPLILTSMLVNFAIGSSFVRSNNAPSKRISPKRLLIAGVGFNLGLLGYFKYADFFVANLNWGLSGSFNLPNVLLPLAISFFTFQQIAYLVDCYREAERKERVGEYDFLNYALFVTFFPQLIAGPIVHHKEMMPQFASASNGTVRYRNVAVGIFIFSIGLFKKIAIADTFALWATPGFDSAASLNFLAAWLTSLSYTFQLYFDFSGYTDMAIGTALLFNIQIPINFNSPYRATDIQDFWRRWHMTLSRFLRDYVYVPLGGNRVGPARTYINILATFLLGGLWHGASWMFVIWGALHGLALVVHRFWRSLGLRMPTALAWFLTFNFVNLAWVFFRAKEMKDALKVIQGMLGMTGIIFPPEFDRVLVHLADFGVSFGDWSGKLVVNGQLLAGLVAALTVVSWVHNSHVVRERWEPKVGMLAVSLAAFWISLLMMAGGGGATSEFLYFNF